MSLRRQRENRQRRRLLAALIEARPWCYRCGRATTELDGHEILSRARGGSITDPDNIALLCRDCHDLVTTEPALAAAEGWSRSQYSGGAA